MSATHPDPTPADDEPRPPLSPEEEDRPAAEPIDDEPRPSLDPEDEREEKVSEPKA